MVAFPPSRDCRTYQLSFGSSVANGGVPAKAVGVLARFPEFTSGFELGVGLVGVADATSVLAKG